MSFKPQNLVLWSALHETAPPFLPQWWGYYTTDDSIATVAGSAYFNTDPSLIIDFSQIRLNDLLYCVCTDGIVELQVTALLPNVTTVTYSIAAGSVGTAALQNLAVTNAKLAAGAVTNAKVDAAAAIDFSKLAALTAAHILVGSVTNVATDVAVTGDITISNAGVTAIGANKVLTSMLSQDTIQYIKVPVTASQFNNMYAAPFVMLAAPGVGKMIVVKQAVLAMTFVAAQYAAGGAVALQYDSTANGAGPLASATLAAATVNAYAASSDVGLAGADASGTSSAKVNKGLYLSNNTAAFTTGDGTWNVHIWYEIVTL